MNQEPSYVGYLNHPHKLICLFKLCPLIVCIVYKDYPLLPFKQRPLEPWPWARTTSVVSPRSPPAPPNLPSGSAHKLADNYYVSRELRRTVAPPTIVSTQKQLKEAGEQLSR